MDVQGSGWGWLGWSKPLNKLLYASTANQDPLVLQVRSSWPWCYLVSILWHSMLGAPWL